MEFSELVSNTQYAFHGIVVGCVLIFAVLVYVFGFKSAEEPPFDKLTTSHDDRKLNGKKRKIKDKKSQTNGHLTSVNEGRKDIKVSTLKIEKKENEKSPSKEKLLPQTGKKSPEKKSALKENRDLKSSQQDASLKKISKGKENVEVSIKNKKNKLADEKPKDFDDGEWEQAVSRKDKKNKKITVDDILQSKSAERKKETKKKSKEDFDLMKTTDIVDPETIVHEPNSVVEVKQELKVESAIESDNDVNDEPKQKRNRKKKGTIEIPAASSTSGEEILPPETTPKPRREKKDTVTTVSERSFEVTKNEEPVSTAIESTVAFDELGDSWKEAKAPKKGGKKKSRKD